MSHVTALKNMPFSFPGLFGDMEWNPDPIAIHVGHGIYWYGIILAIGMLCGMWLSMKQAKRYGLKEEDVANLVLAAVPLCVLGSRLYYVLFNLDFYRTADGFDWARAIAVWDGGIAIYGTVIVGVLTALGFALYNHVPFGAVADMAVPGLMLGQAIGRWANLINREAFGYSTDLPWRMRLWYDTTTYMDVHPTFLYESLWNLAGLILLLAVISRGRRFDGENLCFYFLWYGLGRLWIEGLRADSLYLFSLRFLGQRVRVSQVVSLALALTGCAALWYQIKVRRKTAESLYVNRLAAQAADGPDGVPADGETGAGTDGEPADGTEADGEPADGTEADGEPADGSEADASKADSPAADSPESTEPEAGDKPDTVADPAAEPDRETDAETGTEG